MKKDTNGRYWIRANQGHSIKSVKSEHLLTEITLHELKLNPNKYGNIVHGTFIKNLKPILNHGLSKMTRNHIHFALSDQFGIPFFIVFCLLLCCSH